MDSIFHGHSTVNVLSERKEKRESFGVKIQILQFIFYVQENGAQSRWPRWVEAQQPTKDRKLYFDLP